MTRAELLALAKRVEAATGADRELDKDIGEALGAICEWIDWPDRPQKVLSICNSITRELPAFTASLDSAASLVPEGWAYCVDSNDGGYATVFPRRELGYLPTDPYADAATPALALTAAALRAKAQEKRDE
jgi:hypothetical protein